MDWGRAGGRWVFLPGKDPGVFGADLPQEWVLAIPEHIKLQIYLHFINYIAPVVNLVFMLPS